MVSARSEAKRNRKSRVPSSRLFFIARDAPSERTERAKARDKREKEKNASTNTTPPLSLFTSRKQKNQNSTFEFDVVFVRRFH